MGKRVLITGITGLIGRSVLEKLFLVDNELQITALVRPNTKQSRFNKYLDKIKLEFIDLSNTDGIIKHLEKQSYDVIIHIGALRGGRKFSKKMYYQTNVKSTEQIVEHSLINNTRLLFCSSVGVFGAIPDEMPANNETRYKEDNYYHYTKIVCEKIINKAILKGLDAVILRPSITYGTGDIGFPYQLIKLVKNRLFPMTNKNIWIHLCNIDTIATAFVKLVTEKSAITCKAFNIADLEPVQLRDLVNYIHRYIYNKNYPRFLTIDNGILYFGEKIARLFKNELWISRFELISHSWFYQVHDAYDALDLPSHYTIPDIKLIINNLLKIKEEK